MSSRTNPFRRLGTSTLQVLLLAGLFSSTASADPFAYSSYESLVSDLQALAAAHPQLTELYTAQDRWSLDTVSSGNDELEHWILRITNEQLASDDKAEILLVGGQHGDERVGVETCLQIARLLLENHAAANPDPWLEALVDRREIYIVPMANPHGHRNNRRNSPGTEGSEDMNRDHLYDRCTSFFCFDEVPLSTVGAQALHELARRHNFRIMLDYHGGIEMIIYPWGTPLHVSDTESPDDRAHQWLGERMSSYGGPYNGFYPVGTSNDLLGSVNAPLDDTAYATGWDPANADALASEAPGWRALAYTVEISNSKGPAASTLGGDADVLTPGGSEDGYVPKSLRVGLAAIDLIEPWIEWVNRDQIPATVEAGETVTIEWQVRGCFDVDETRVRWGTSIDPTTVFDGQSTLQAQSTGEPCWLNPTLFTADLSFDQAGEVSIVPVARVDSALLSQQSPDPSLTPRSWLVRSRTEDGQLASNTVDSQETSTVVARTVWSAEPLRILVQDGAIFSDDFESGNTSSWTAQAP